MFTQEGTLIPGLSVILSMPNDIILENVRYYEIRSPAFNITDFVSVNARASFT